MPGTIYFVTALSAAPKVKERLKNLLPEGDIYELAGDKWLVVFEGSTRDLAERAGVRAGDERIGTGLVLPVTTYSGRAQPDLWDWLRAKEA